MNFFPIINGTAAVKGKNGVISWVSDKGKIEIVSFKKKKNFFGINFPFIRGIYFSFIGIYLFIISINKSGVFLNDKNRNKHKKKLKMSLGVVTLTVIGICFAVTSFVSLFLIPNFLFKIMIANKLNVYLAGFIVGITRILFFILMLLSLKLIPSIRQFYRNNSACNLALASFKNKKINSYYLSTNYLNFLVWSFIISFFVLSFIVLETNFFLKFLINFGIIIVCLGIVYEILKLIEFKDCLFLKLIINPIAYLTGEKPTQTEREIAFSAMNEVMLMEENEERIVRENKQQIAFSVVLCEVKRRLCDAGIVDDLEAEWLIANSLNIGLSDLKLLTHISNEQYEKIKLALEKREQRIPISKIFNRCDFYGRDFYVNNNVLSPRQETELVVEQAIQEIKKINKRAKVLDLMTGSGVIAITIALETNSNVYASDISKQALEVAKKNAKKHNAKIKFIESDIFKSFKHEKFDVIVSNPPYICSKDILTLDEEVKKYDPLISLDGGEDGLFFYKEIANNCLKFLKDNGVLVLEIGYNQGQSVKKLLQNNFKNIRIKKDYSGNDRIVIASKK